jgi:hypothetical protein
MEIDTKYLEYLINQMDWIFISQSLSQYPAHNGKNTEEITKHEKQKLLSRIGLMQKLNLHRLYCNNWVLIHYFKNDEPSFKIYFIPRSYIVQLSDAEKGFKTSAYAKNKEWKYLYKLMHELSNKQEFEKCQLIKERLNQIINEMD